MKIQQLKIIQDELRNPKDIIPMAKFVVGGGIFCLGHLAEYLDVLPSEDLLIELVRFPDGEVYVHDGHHRAVAIYLAGRKFLHEDEYYLVERSYEDYQDIVFMRNGYYFGYVTPFNVKSEARFGDISAWKHRVKNIYFEQSPQHAKHLIETRPDLYKRAKKFSSVEELANETRHYKNRTGN